MTEDNKELSVSEFAPEDEQVTRAVETTLTDIEIANDKQEIETDFEDNMDSTIEEDLFDDELFDDDDME